MACRPIRWEGGNTRFTHIPELEHEVADIVIQKIKESIVKGKSPDGESAVRTEDRWSDARRDGSKSKSERL